MSKKVNNRFQKQLERFRWEDFPIGGIVRSHRHVGEWLIPSAYECVAKRSLRSGQLQLVMLELCFELSVEQSIDGVILGAARPLVGKYATGEPTIIERGTELEPIIKGDPYSIWAGSPMRFRIAERSYHLRVPSGGRLFADEKKP